ncbi:MAG TPA: thiol reductase thioredoxin, partial [Rhodanobacter sp.]|nr:thiol reductase thioredoxin [Rhodanobacter sp.]
MSTSIDIPCAHCHALNRVPAARIDEAPRCGRCKEALFQGHPLELTTANFDALA